MSEGASLGPVCTFVPMGTLSPIGALGPIRGGGVCVSESSCNLSPLRALGLFRAGGVCVHWLIYILGLCILHVLSLLNLLQILAPSYTLNNLNRDRQLCVWPLGQIGDWHRKDKCQNYFLSTSVLFFSNSCYLGSSWLPCMNVVFTDKSTEDIYGRPGLGGCDPTLLVFSSLLDEMSFVMWLEPKDWSNLVNKHLYPSILNLTSKLPDWPHLPVECL